MAREGFESLYPPGCNRGDGPARSGARDPRDPAACAPGGGLRASEPRPDVVVLIDRWISPIASPRASRSAILPIRTVDYVAPQVTGPSRAYRAKKMAHAISTWCWRCFRFEVPFFERYGVRAALCRPSGDRAGARRMAGGAALRMTAAGASQRTRRCWRCCQEAAPARSVSSCPSSAKHAGQFMAPRNPRPGHGAADRAPCRGKSARRDG